MIKTLGWSAATVAAPLLSAPAVSTTADAVIHAARILLPHLEHGRRVEAQTLRAAMETAFGGSDATGTWDWKTAYEACEAATILFLRKFGSAIRAKAASPAPMLPLFARIANLLPTHTRRSEESQAFQQFSTPIALGLVAAAAAAITPDDLVLEPSAGTGLLAILVELSGGSLVLNELAETRSGLLGHLFPGVEVTRFDAANIHDHLDASINPSVVLMNPPFSAVANVDRRMADAALRHVASALARLVEGGRLVAITGASCAPDNPTWGDAFVHLQEQGRIVFTAAIDGSVYAKHGTTIDTRLIASVERDLGKGHAAVIQIVSTGEALMERRLAEIPTEEWGDVQVDITPREYVLDYLAHSFPTQLFEPFTDGEGNLASRPVYRDGQPVQCRDAVDRRDRLIEKLASLAPVHGALDQIVQRFGTEIVAEVTGRSRRIVRKTGSDGVDRLTVENRAGSANLGETQAFMDDLKRILVFSEAGGTGRSYHAELSAKNRRLRVHYLLEAGWKADAAIQGLGRTNRTNQAQPPLFRPIATDVKAEKRFLSTVARRLDTLGAITKGQRQTGGQGLFRPEDNLESHYARDALRQLYVLLVMGKVDGCALQAFEDATGLKLTDSAGIKDDLPPITTFLNRLLALTIDLQNILFTAFEQLLTARIEGAIASGTYDVGLETLNAESFIVTDRRTIYTHPGTSAETRLLTITQRERNRPVTLEDALDRLSDPRAMLLVNSQSGRAAVQTSARSLMLDDGQVERRVRLVRPMEAPTMPLATMPQTHWRDADRESFARAWEAEIADVPLFTDTKIHIVSGLLLPIWKRLPNESSRVYRLQTDAGERIVGRKVSPGWAADALETGEPKLSPDDAFTALIDGSIVLDLTEGLQLRRVRIMGVPRIELTGFTDPMRDRLGAYGLFYEIISWKLRMFVPTEATGRAIMAKVLERYPVSRIADRVAA